MKRALLLSLLVALLSVGAGYARTHDVPVIDDDPPDCQQIPPEEVPAPVLDPSERLALRTRFVFERGDRGLVKEYVGVTKRAFGRIGIDLLPSFDALSVPGSWEDAPLSAEPSRDEQFALVKERYGGKRPDGIDVVYFFSRYWAGGFAECIGGIRSPELAFALGSIDYKLEGLVPAPTVNEGVIAAHEIGHLLGAHHHYSNCAEAVPLGALAGDPGACTVMSPLAYTASSTFGLIESSFIRSYAADYGIENQD